MYSLKFQRFIEIWQKEFGIEKTIEEKKSIDKDDNPIPWYTYPAIEYLSQFDYSDKKVFEFGVGYSSLFWANRAKKVISIEDNPSYFERWTTEFKKENLDIRWRDEGEIYENAIFEDEDKYDVIIIDGKRRFPCAEVALKKISNNGFIILDDSDRVNTSHEYVNAINTLKQGNFLQVDFYGFCPMNNFSKTTTLFMQKDFDFKTIDTVQPTNGIGNLWAMERAKRKAFFKE
ncbi:MAG: SAM-dependent methyltransferase [Alphaproteobacteria bacterium]